MFLQQLWDPQILQCELYEFFLKVQIYTLSDTVIKMV